MLTFSLQRSFMYRGDAGNLLSRGTPALVRVARRLHRTRAASRCRAFCCQPWCPAAVLWRRLYTTVLSTIKGFGNLFWVDVVAQIDAMTEQVQGFQAQSKKLPKVRACQLPAAPLFNNRTVVGMKSCMPACMHA